MRHFQRFAMHATLWLAVAAGIGALVIAYQSGYTSIGAMAASLDDPLPGAKFKPTAEQMERAHASAMRRRAE